MSEAVDLIKEIAINAVSAEKPVETVTGVVTGVSPLEIQTEQKLVLPEEVLVLTSRVKDKTLVIRKGLKEGEEVIMQRIQGGQQYVVLDRIKNDVVDMELSYDL